MATSSLDIQKALRKNLMQAYKLYDPAETNNFHRAMAGKIINSKQQFEEMAAFGGLSLPTETAEFEAPPVTEQEQIYTGSYTARKQSLQLRVSQEAFDDEQPNYGIVRSYGTDMAGMFHQRLEADAADEYMNFVDVRTLPNGEVIAIATHQLEAGTDSNILSPAETASPEALRKMRGQLRRTKAHKGMVMPIMDNVVIECHSDNEDIWDEVWKSRNKAHEMSNTTNVQGQYIASIIGNPYFTNRERFCVRAKGDTKHGRFMIMRKALKFSDFEYDQDAGAFKIRGDIRYIFNRFGYRGEIFSLA